MRTGAVARVEEVTRCLPEVQDALVSILSDRRDRGPRADSRRATTAPSTPRPGFNVIATANLRDRGVSEMSAALKRRFNFETVAPIADLAAEIDAGPPAGDQSPSSGRGPPFAVDDAVLDALVTAFRDLRGGRSDEGWAVERPSTVMSTAEAVERGASSLGIHAAYLGGIATSCRCCPGHLLGVVRKDDPHDQGRLLGYWDAAVKRACRVGRSDVAKAVGAALGDRGVTAEAAAPEEVVRNASEALWASRDPLIIGVRHHSPALAAAIPAILDDFAPERVLIELPMELEPWIEWLAHPDTIAPVALAAVREDGGALSFYPFADFSPELAAIRWASRAGVPVAACDLPWSSNGWRSTPRERAAPAGRLGREPHRPPLPNGRCA